MEKEVLSDLKEMEEIQREQARGPKLTNDQRALILRWLAAGFTNRSIMAMCRRYRFPSLTEAMICYYRKHYSDSDIAEARKKFIETALNQGWADRKNRVELLSAMLESWTGREPDSKEVSDMALKIEAQLSQRVDEPALQKVELTFGEPKPMKDLVEGLEDEG